MKLINLIFDLDETLIHSVPISSTKFNVYKRPLLDNFLNSLKKLNVNVSIWSAGEESYVISIVDKIFADFNPIFVFSRKECLECQKLTGQLKNFSYLEKKIPRIYQYGVPILIDDLEENCLNNNYILIKPFDNILNVKDAELNNIYKLVLKILKN